MSSGYIPISDGQLILSVVLVFITGGISALLQLGLLKSLVWGTIRAFIQLTLIGYILTYIFQINKLVVIIPIILLMSFIASREATRRIGAFSNQVWRPFIALTASAFIVGVIVLVLIISPHPWYSAQIMIPIFGMLLGNSMNAIALSLDRMYSEINGYREKVQQMLCFGATPWEAIMKYARRALVAGMTPSINSLMVVGLVSLPGMMTGQIIAGMNPQSAVRYQFVIMIMMTACTAIGCLIIISLSYKNMFNDDLALVETLHEN